MMMRKRKTQVKGEDKDKGKDQETPLANPRFFAATTLTLKPPKPSITEYFSKMSSVTPITDALEEEHRCDTIMINRNMRSRTKTH